MPTDLVRLQHLLQIYKGLVEVSALINAITESEELLPAILEVARRVLQAEAASLFLVRPNGELELTNACGPQSSSSLAEEEKIIVPRGRGISGWVLENGQPLLIPDAYADPRFYPEVDRRTGFRTRSILCTPLVHNGSEIGVLQVLNPLGRECFDAADLEALVAYGTLAATAIEKLRTIERQMAQERVAHELAAAREIQTSFLPQTLPSLINLEFGALYRPAQLVGGDFYDVIVLSPEEIFFVIGDVAGKGMPAALLMAQALSILRLILTPGICPQVAMERWNTMLSGHPIRGMFITALLGRIHVATNEVELCSAGHCHPLRIDAAGRCKEHNVRGAPPLGLLRNFKTILYHFQLAPQEWLILYTDGLTEAFDAQGEDLEVGGVCRLFSTPHSGSDQVIQTLQKGEAHHRQETPPHDDLTLLVFGFK